MNNLRAEIAAKERELQALKDRLSQVERDCAHSWGPTFPDHIVREAYTIPADPPGTMGIDWRGEQYVPAQTQERWKRTCQICGKVEHTTQKDVTTTSIPRFPDTR